MPGPQGDRWIGRPEALVRLGVKTQTLYAYVSRGRITARPDPTDPRRSLYSVRDVLRLTGDEGDLAIGTVLPAPVDRHSRLDLASTQSVAVNGRLLYRGRDAGILADTLTLEDAARLLWGGTSANPFAVLRPRVGATPGGSPRARLFVALARRAEEDADHKERSPEALAQEAARVLDEAVDAIVGPGPRLFLHQRLARAWKVGERDAALIRRALVLALDDPNDSGAAAATRMAARGGASPAGAALSGLAVLTASPVMGDIARSSAWVQVVRRQATDAARRAHEAGALAGFGDAAWPHGDPRAEALLSATNLPADMERALREGREISGQLPNFGLALVALARRLELPREAAADLLLIGRLAGLLGHVLDQVTNGSPIGVTLRYVGPDPGDTRSPAH